MNEAKVLHQFFSIKKKLSPAIQSKSNLIMVSFPGFASAPVTKSLWYLSLFTSLYALREGFLNLIIFHFFKDCFILLE